ncbi:hypothetical protein D6D13_04706 [Aureobasidium pullulans]|uniref:Uncharacterized protein n=1 Tax=Aureobasidium pullulans TaxID=5580 RepID=A0A4S9CXN5_AURPU|nr:hypothetical protein D6D13_04706 [Aureobasidium pullulans]
MGCLSAIFVRSDDSRDCHNIHGRKYLGNTDRNLVGTQAYTVNILINYIDAASLDALTHTLPKFTRRSATEGPMPYTTSRDEWTFATFMNSFNFDTYKWGGMDSSPLSHSAPLTANTLNGQDWQQLTRLGAGILAIHAV